MALDGSTPSGTHEDLARTMAARQNCQQESRFPRPALISLLSRGFFTLATRVPTCCTESGSGRKNSTGSKVLRDRASLGACPAFAVSMVPDLAIVRRRFDLEFEPFNPPNEWVTKSDIKRGWTRMGRPISPTSHRILGEQPVTS